MHVFKPLPPLSIIDPGITPYAGSSLWLQSHRQSETRFRPAQDATGLQRFGGLSLAWVLQVLAPLLIVVLGFASVAHERESGVLKQTLSQGVALRTVLLGKALALGGAVLAVLLPVALLSAVVVLMAAAQGDAGAAGHSVVEAGLRLLGLGLGYLLYLGGVVLIVVAVSAWARSARMAIVVLMGGWILGVTVLPRLVTDAVRDALPTPSRAAFSKALDGQLEREYTAEWKRSFGTGARWGTELSLSQWGRALQVDDAVGYRVSDQHFGQLWRTYQAQVHAQEWLGLGVPLLAVRSWSMTMAGTDFDHHRRFADAAERHRRLMQDLISEDLVRHADSRGEQHFTYKAGPELWRQVPPFVFAGPGAAQSASLAWRAMLALGIVTLMAGGVLVWQGRWRPA